MAKYIKRFSSSLLTVLHSIITNTDKDVQGLSIYSFEVKKNILVLLKLLISAENDDVFKSKFATVFTQALQLVISSNAGDINQTAEGTTGAVSLASLQVECQFILGILHL